MRERANEQLAMELQAANRQVEQMAGRMKALAAARERQHLGRELHDSVTQTVFSLSLAVQSARLLVERHPERVPEHLDHLTALAQQALAQMHTLVSELKPGGPGPGELPEALRRHLAAAFLPEGLSVALDVEDEAEGALTPEEEQALFAIAREALNNIVKHSGATQAARSPARGRTSRTRGSRQRTRFRPPAGAAGGRVARDVRARGRHRLASDRRIGARRRDDAAREQDSVG